MENRAFNSGVHINFRRGAEGEGAYFLPTGYITCTDQEKTHKTIAVVTQNKKERERDRKKEIKRIQGKLQIQG